MASASLPNESWLEEEVMAEEGVMEEGGMNGDEMDDWEAKIGGFIRLISLQLYLIEYPVVSLGKQGLHPEVFP